MATRAAFWVGNPQDLQHREWLGCMAWDGYPDGYPSDLRFATDESSYRRLVSKIAIKVAPHFARPEHGWPYPWDDNIFLTDYTYTWMDGQVMVTCFHRGFFPLTDYLSESSPAWAEDEPDTLPENVTAPSAYNPEQPDSIIIISHTSKEVP